MAYIVHSIVWLQHPNIHNSAYIAIFLQVLCLPKVPIWHSPEAGDTPGGPRIRPAIFIGKEPTGKLGTFEILGVKDRTLAARINLTAPIFHLSYIVSRPDVTAPKRYTIQDLAGWKMLMVDAVKASGIR